MIKYTTHIYKPDTFEVERREVELPKLMVDTLLRSIELLPFIESDFIESDDEYFVTPPMFSPDMSSITVGVLCNGKKFKMEISKAE